MEFIVGSVKLRLQIYRGYVDDPRNTDNSWMETIAYNFHDEEGTSVGQFHLHAGKHSMAAIINYCCYFHFLSNWPTF